MGTRVQASGASRFGASGVEGVQTLACRISPGNPKLGMLPLILTVLNSENRIPDYKP